MEISEVTVTESDDIVEAAPVADNGDAEGFAEAARNSEVDSADNADEAAEAASESEAAATVSIVGAEVAAESAATASEIEARMTATMASLSSTMEAMLARIEALTAPPADDGNILSIEKEPEIEEEDVTPPTTHWYRKKWGGN